MPYILSNVRNALLKKWSMMTNTAFSRPYQVSIEANERCNARCLMCDCWKETEDYLTSQEIIGVISELKAWIGPHFFLQIAGGEPLIFIGIYEIFRYCADNGILCKISTNGITLNSKAVCDRVINSGLKYLTVSIDSHVPEVHDRYRGVKGAFDRAMKGLTYLRKNSDMVLGVSAIIMKENAASLRELTDFFCSLDIDRILFQPVRAYGMKVSEWKNYQFWVQDLEALDKGLRYIKRKKKEDRRITNSYGHLDIMSDYFRDPRSIASKRKCSIGFEHIEISYKGDLFLCNAYPAVGNIKESSVREMWISDKAREIRRKMVSCTLPCTSNCKKELSLKEKIDKFMVFFKAGLFR
jgi:MoaA/NifB/PqqE/SkfB family radical SAM enzyme